MYNMWAVQILKRGIDKTRCKHGKHENFGENSNVAEACLPRPPPKMFYVNVIMAGSTNTTAPQTKIGQVCERALFQINSLKKKYYKQVEINCLRISNKVLKFY